MKRVRTSTSSQQPDSGAPRRQVLYVEDDEANRQVASMRLAKKYDVCFAKNDAEACQALAQLGSSIEVILLDIELRGSRLNGVDLARLIRGLLPDESKPPYALAVRPLEVPILFVTAYAQAYRRAELLAAGGDEVIAKPVDFVALHTTIARVYLQRLK